MVNKAVQTSKSFLTKSATGFIKPRKVQTGLKTLENGPYPDLLKQISNMRKNITSPKDSKAKPEHRKSDQPSSTKNMRESETSRTSLQQRSRLISIQHDQASEDDVSDTKDK